MEERKVTVKRTESKARRPGVMKEFCDFRIDQPMKFEFVINLKTANQIGLTIPQWTLMKATKVIQ